MILLKRSDLMKINVTGGTLPQQDIDGDYVNCTYHFCDQPFERIRRITGYLVGTLDRFNNAKRAEEADRVKHGLTQQ